MRAQNANCVDYAIVGEAWHDPTDLLSTPDNQNKELVKVFLGTDPATGDQLYDMHPRRAQLYTNVRHAALHEFRVRHSLYTSLFCTTVYTCRYFTLIMTGHCGSFAARTTLRGCVGLQVQQGARASFWANASWWRHVAPASSGVSRQSAIAYTTRSAS